MLGWASITLFIEGASNTVVFVRSIALKIKVTGSLACPCANRARQSIEHGAINATSVRSARLMCWTSPGS